MSGIRRRSLSELMAMAMIGPGNAFPGIFVGGEPYTQPKPEPTPFEKLGLVVTASDTQRMADAEGKRQGRRARMQYLNGIPVIVTPDAMENTDVRTFPESKHRSERIRKKLVKRFNGEFVKQPCIFQTGRHLIMHPAIYERLQREGQTRKAPTP